MCNQSKEEKVVDFHNNSANILGKIFTNFIFWMSVALSFPLVGTFANGYSGQEKFSKEVFFEINKYLDAKLFFGIFVGCFLFGFIYASVSKIRRRFCWKYSGAEKVAADEIVSELMSVGSIINVVFLFQIIILSVDSFKAAKIERVSNEFWWTGICFWIIAYVIDFLFWDVNCEKSDKNKDDEISKSHKQDVQKSDNSKDGCNN